MRCIFVAKEPEFFQIALRNMYILEKNTSDPRNLSLFSSTFLVISLSFPLYLPRILCSSSHQQQISNSIQDGADVHR